MARAKIISAIGLVVILALVSSAQTDERREGGDPPTMVGPSQPQPRVGPGPIPPMQIKELAEQLRARAREAQELSDRLRRQADELDQMAQRRMGGGPGPQQMEQRRRELDEIREAIGRAEREGRWQEAEELRRHAEQLMGRPQPMPPGPRMEERQELKRQIERLRDEARRAKEQGRMEDSERVWKEADRLEQVLREQGPREGGEFGRPMLPEGERQETKRKIEELRNEARRAKEENRREDAERLGQEANRLEQQLREQGPREKGEFGGPMPPEVQDILRAAEQAEREGRLDEARRQREKAEIVARELQEQRGRRVLGEPGPRGDQRPEMKRKIEELRNEARRAKEGDRREDAERLGQEANRLEQQLREQGGKGQGPETPNGSFREEVIRSMEGLKKEIGRLWQAVNEMRNRPRENR
jgi:HPt (histidine-containing phosphotransfer) domain-containing protein